MQPPEYSSGPDPSSKSRMRSAVSWVVTAFLLVLTVSVVLIGVLREEAAVAPQVRRRANVEVRTIVQRPYREALVLPARLEADRVAAIAPEFGGKLISWHVPEGARVERGQAVAALDTELLRSNLRELQVRRRSAALGVESAVANLAAAEAALEGAHKDAEVQQLLLRGAHSARDLAETEYKRVQELVSRGVMDQARLDTAADARTQAEVRVDTAEESVAGAALAVRSAQASVSAAHAGRDVARSTVEELDAAIASVEVRIGKATLRAPLDGRLEEHLMEVGEVLQEGTPIARIYDLTTLRAVVSVPDRYVAFLDPTNPVVSEYIRLERPQARQDVRAVLLIPGLPKLTGGEEQGVELPAVLQRIAQSGDPTSNTFPVELRVTNPGEALKHGLIARARIEYLSYPEAIVIPVQAVQVTDAGPRVMVAEREQGRDVARVRDIVPASVRDDQLLVLSGLAPGERLLVSGWKGLVSGEPVSVLVEDGVAVSAGGE